MWGTLLHSNLQVSLFFEDDADRMLFVATAQTMQFVAFLFFSKIYILAFVFFSKTYTSSKTLQKRIYIFLIFICVLCSLINTMLINTGLALTDEPELIFYVAVAAICVLAMLMITFYIYYSLSKQSDMLLQAQSELQHRTLMEQHNIELIKVDASLRNWRHDIHNHFQSLQALIQIGDIDKAEKYLAHLGHKFKIDGSVCNTGQHELDAIVTVKCALAKADDIKVALHIIPIKHLPISDLDITNLFGNLFDNAIESCRRVDVKARFISLAFLKMENMLCIRMVNSTDGNIKLENGRYLTTKSDSRFHGLGLASIDRIINDAGGFVSREYNDKDFTTELLLPTAGA
jgi:sensor histidine kinase YesM